MKPIIVCIIFIFCNILNINAQCSNFYIITPNKSNIRACISGGFPDWYVQAADQQSRSYAIEVFEAGTNSYNCHAYAWHVKEGGYKYWINNMGLST